jgi:hypothetical protein
VNAEPLDRIETEDRGPEPDETGPTPPEYDLFRAWFDAWQGAGEFQDMYRAFQAGYRAQVAEPEPGPCPECGSLLAYSHCDGCSHA